MKAERPAQLRRKDLLGIEELSREEIELVLDTAVAMREVSTRDVKKVPTLRGQTVVNLFFEPSTRTRTSFEIAAKRLSADTINLTPQASSLVKGETLLDMIRNLEAMMPRFIVLRHQASGVPHLVARAFRGSVVNAGDGSHEHPTQALLDLLTAREKLGRIEGATVAILGDIAFSRVARSNLHGFRKMGAKVRLVGPPTMIPPGVDRLGVEVFHDVNRGIRDADLVMVLRLQLERQAGNLFPSIREYARWFGLGPAQMASLKPGAIVMHPGPMNRGVEISSEVADGPASVILQQVTNGIAVRMAVLYLLATGRGEA